MMCVGTWLSIGDIKCTAECKFNADNSNISGEKGAAKSRMRLVIYILKEGNRVLISLRSFSFSKHSKR